MSPLGAILYDGIAAQAAVEAVTESTINIIGPLDLEALAAHVANDLADNTVVIEELARSVFALKMRLRAFGRDCVANGDMTPAAKRMLEKILMEES